MPNSEKLTPVFIGGCGRSGTTLLGAMLGSHDECIATPESQFVTNLLRSNDWEEDTIEFHKVMKKIKSNWRFKLWNLDIASNLDEKPEFTYSQLITWIVSQYSKTAGKKSATIWIDHTPTHIKYGKTLVKLFPNAKIIHLLRDGRAVAASIIPLDWGPNTIIEAAHYWTENVTYGLAAECHWDSSRIINVRYEDLLQEPDVTTKRICSFLGIKFQSKMVNGTNYSVPQYTRQQHSLVGKKPDVARINAWEKQLTPRQIEIFERLTGELLSYLNYPLKYGLKAKELSRGERISLTFQELSKRWVTNKFRKKVRGKV